MVVKLCSWNPDPGTGPQVLPQRVEGVTQLRVQSLLPLLQQENPHFYGFGVGGFYQLTIAPKYLL